MFYQRLHIAGKIWDRDSIDSFMLSVVLYEQKLMKHMVREKGDIK